MEGLPVYAKVEGGLVYQTVHLNFQVCLVVPLAEYGNGTLSMYNSQNEFFFFDQRNNLTNNDKHVIIYTVSVHFLCLKMGLFFFFLLSHVIA